MNDINFLIYFFIFLTSLTTIFHFAWVPLIEIFHNKNPNRNQKYKFKLTNINNIKLPNL